MVVSGFQKVKSLVDGRSWRRHDFDDVKSKVKWSNVELSPSHKQLTVYDCKMLDPSTLLRTSYLLATSTVKDSINGQGVQTEPLFHRFYFAIAFLH